MFPSICLAKQCFSTAHSISKPTQDPILRSLAPPCLSALFSQIQNLLFLKLAKICSSVSFYYFKPLLTQTQGLFLLPGAFHRSQECAFMWPRVLPSRSRRPPPLQLLPPRAEGGRVFPPISGHALPTFWSAERALPSLAQARSEGSGPTQVPGLRWVSHLTRGVQSFQLLTPFRLE